VSRTYLGAVLVTAIVASATAAVARAVDGPPPPATPVSTPLVIALGLQSPDLQAGVVRGRDVVLARGFEVELARVLARRLGTRVGRFVYVPSATRLLAANGGDWQLAFAGIEQPTGRTAAADLTAPYLTSDVAVVTRRGLPAPRRLADLRRLLVCAVRGSAAARAAGSAVRPARVALLVAGSARLLALVRTGACDAALVPAVKVGRFVAGHRRALGSVSARVRSGEGLVAIVSRTGGLDVKAVDRELGRLRRDGTLGRLARTWLGLDPAGLRVLR
jgi:ABC-type amino acid transport substrate-binding protein